MTDDPRLEKLRERLTGTRQRAPGTLSTYLYTARCFLTWLNKEGLDRTDVDKYFAFRRHAGISERTLAKEFVHLKKLFLANEVDWPFEKEDTPVADDKEQPAISEDSIKQLILQQHLLTGHERFYLAISTTWGSRVEEMSRLIKRDYDCDTVTLKIAKQKKMVKRVHLIPAELAPVFERHRFSEHQPESIAGIFRRICQKAGIEREEREGFHSIRRRLARHFENAVYKNARGEWASAYPLWAQSIGWSQAQRGKMFAGSATAGHYAGEGEDQHRIDRILYSIHPFLKVWAAALADKPVQIEPEANTLAQDETVLDLSETETPICETVTVAAPQLSPLDEIIARMKAR